MSESRRGRRGPGDPPRGEVPSKVDTVVCGSPKLRDKPWRVTDRDIGEDYNCFGYALCSRYYGWEDPVSAHPASEQMDRMDGFVTRRGWTRSADCKPKRGFRKIAVYCKKETGDVEVPTHVAKQIVDDWWESKLGLLYRFMHPGADGAERESYGKPCRCYEKSLAVLLAEARALRDEIDRQADSDIAWVNRANDARHSADPAEAEQGKKDLEQAEKHLEKTLKALEEIDQWIADLTNATALEAP